MKELSGQLGQRITLWASARKLYRLVEVGGQLICSQRSEGLLAEGEPLTSTSRAERANKNGNT